MVRNLVLWRLMSGAVKRNFQPYIRRFTSRNENFEYGYPHLQSRLKMECCKQHDKRDKINEVKLFAIVYLKIYSSKFVTSNQMSCYICE